MSLLQTGHEHLGYLGSFHNVIFCSKLTSVLLFFIFAGSCCHDYGPLYTIISSPEYTAFGNRLLRSLGFLMVYGIFLSLNISFIIGGDRHFRYLKILIISCWFEYFLFECLVSPPCSIVLHSSTSFWHIIVMSSKYFDFSRRPNGSKHPNKRTITELYTDESVWHTLFCWYQKGKGTFENKLNFLLTFLHLFLTCSLKLRCCYVVISCSFLVIAFLSQISW